MTNQMIKERLDKAKYHFDEYLINKSIKGKAAVNKRAKSDMDTARQYIYRIFNAELCYLLFDTKDPSNDQMTIAALIDDLKSGDGFEYTYNEIRERALKHIS